MKHPIDTNFIDSQRLIKVLNFEENIEIAAFTFKFLHFTIKSYFTLAVNTSHVYGFKLPNSRILLMKMCKLNLSEDL